MRAPPLHRSRLGRRAAVVIAEVVPTVRAVLELPAPLLVAPASVR
jgi:hypothetical protein